MEPRFDRGNDLWLPSRFPDEKRKAKSVDVGLSRTRDVQLGKTLQLRFLNSTEFPETHGNARRCHSFREMVANGVTTESRVPVKMCAERVRNQAKKRRWFAEGN